MKISKKAIKAMVQGQVTCAVKDCKKKATIFYKGVGLCKEHGEDWSNVEKYVEGFKTRQTQKWKKKKQGSQTQGKYSHAQNAERTKTGTPIHSEHTEST